MTPIPGKLKKEILEDPFYKTCALYDHQGHQCEGRITFEHTLIFASNQIQEKWAIIPLCAKAHQVDEFQDSGGMRKELNVWVALNRATDEELLKYSKCVPYVRERTRLNKVYGVWEHKVPTDLGIYSKTPIKLPESFGKTKSRFEGVWYPINKRVQGQIEKIQSFYLSHGRVLSEFEAIEWAIEKEIQVIEEFSKRNNK